MSLLDQLKNGNSLETVNSISGTSWTPSSSLWARRDGAPPHSHNKGQHICYKPESFLQSSCSLLFGGSAYILLAPSSLEGALNPYSLLLGGGVHCFLLTAGLPTIIPAVSGPSAPRLHWRICTGRHRPISWQSRKIIMQHYSTMRWGDGTFLRLLSLIGHGFLGRILSRWRNCVRSRT